MADGLDYRIVDVFTDRPFAGNPLAVVLGAQGLSGVALAAIAREFNLSETAFPLPPQAEADYRVRIFTPAAELPFAGHPSVGTAWVLADLGRLAPGRAVQECGAGLLPVQVSPDGGPVRLFGGAARAGKLADPQPLLAAVGLPAGRHAGPPALVAGAGLDFAYLPVTAEALDELRPDPRAVGRRARELGCAGISVVHVSGGLARARVLAGGVGVDEDPATGSAALGLGAALVSWGLAAADGVTDYTVEQGAQIGRPSTMRCSVRAAGGRVAEVSVAGGVVPVAAGRIRIP